MVIYNFSLSTWEAEAVVSQEVQGQPELQRVPDQPGLHSEILFLKNKEKKSASCLTL